MRYITHFIVTFFGCITDLLAVQNSKFYSSLSWLSAKLNTVCLKTRVRCRQLVTAAPHRFTLKPIYTKFSIVFGNLVFFPDSFNFFHIKKTYNKSINHTLIVSLFRNVFLASKSIHQLRGPL